MALAHPSYPRLKRWSANPICLSKGLYQLGYPGRPCSCEPRLILEIGGAGAKLFLLGRSFYVDALSLGRRTIAAAALAAAWAVLALIASPGGAIAARGGVDASFGNGGRSVFELGPVWRAGGPTEMAVEPEGGVRVTFRDGEWAGEVVPRRFGPDGTPDPSYVPAVPPAKGARADLPDGRVVMIDFVGGDSKLVRYNPDGSLDTSFGSGGVGDGVRPGNIEDELVVAPDGSMYLLSGVLSMGKGPTRAGTLVIKFRADGTRETGYGNNGVASLSGPGYGGLPRGVEPHGDGLLLRIEEEAKLFGTGPESLVRLTAAGELDKSFGSGGVLDLEKTMIVGVHALPDGRFMTLFRRDRGVWGYGVHENDLVVARYGYNGMLDPSYGVGGEAQLEFGPLDDADAALWSDDGSAVVAGRSAAPTAACREFPNWCRWVPAVHGLTAAGAPDSAFSAGPVPLSALGAEIDEWRTVDVARRPGGGYFLSGNGRASSYLMATTPAGGLDPSFGNDGLHVERIPSESPGSTVSDLAVEADGRILVAGRTNAGRDWFAEDGAIVRLSPDGAVDPGYGDGPGFARVPGMVNRISLDGSGRTLALGFERSAVIRIGADGRLDPSFGREGMVIFDPFEEDAYDPTDVRLSAIAALPDGGAIVAGARLGMVVVYRLRPDGVVDSTFGAEGETRLGFGQPATKTHGLGCVVRELVVQRDGRILLAGGCVLAPRTPDRYRPPRRMVIAALTPEGNPDPSFGRRGRRIFAMKSVRYASGLALSGKRILVATQVQPPHRRFSRFLLMRLRGDGTLDRGFGRRGVALAGVLRSDHDKCTDGFERVSILPTRKRIVVVRNGPGLPVLAFGHDGSPRRRYGRDRKIASNRVPYPGCHPGPMAALQGTNPILAWTTPDPRNRRQAIQRLTP